MTLNSAFGTQGRRDAAQAGLGDQRPPSLDPYRSGLSDRANANLAPNGTGAEIDDPFREAELDRQVKAEQIRMFYQQLPVATALSVLAAVVLAVVLSPVANQSALFAWLAVMLMLQGLRVWFFLPFHLRGITDDESVPWGRNLVIATTLSGITWGAASVIFFNSSPDEYQTSLIVMIFAIAAVGGPLTASYRPSLFGFVVPTLLPVVGTNFFAGDGPHLVLSAIAFCVLLGILAVGLKYNRLLSQALRNRFRVQELASRLQVQNAELERAREVSESASRAKSQFFAAASHDLRQPLHAIGLFAESLAEKVSDPDAIEATGNIGASVAALEALFNELLDVSRIDAGGVVAHASDFDLQPLLDRLAADFDPEASAKGLQFRLRASGERVRSDPLLLERILRNLVANAIRYTDKGGVLVGCRRRRFSLRIEVWDTGVGIADKYLTCIFDEFVQLSNPERDQRRGLGLGLSIVRRLAQILKHPLGLDSRLGRGSVFRIDVPLSSMSRTEPQAVSADVNSVRGFSGKLIVVVDDQQAVLDGMSALLRTWDADVICSLSTADALAALKALGDRPPDLIIADYQLQGDELGTETIVDIRAYCRKDVAAIVITGDTSPERLATARSSGFHWLTKPVRPAKLRALVNFELNPPTNEP